MRKSQNRRVAVTGLGLVSPFADGAGADGSAADAFFARIMRGESAVRLYQHPTSPSPLQQPAVACSTFDSEKTTALIRKYEIFSHPAALEIIRWLKGEYHVTRELVLTQ